MYKKLNHDESYAHSAQSRLGSAVTRCLENATVRSALLSSSPNLRTNIHSEQNFWQSIMEGYWFTINILQGELGDIPIDQPLIVLASHPHGILDGFVMGSVRAQSGVNFKTIANDIFNEAQEISDNILPISFKNTREAISLNLITRKNALAHLSHGGAIGIFPSGTVSTSSKLFSQSTNPEWRSFTAKMIFKSNALVVPIFLMAIPAEYFNYPVIYILLKQLVCYYVNLSCV